MVATRYGSLSKTPRTSRRRSGPTDLVGLSDALSTLAAFDARMSDVVELRFFGGLSVQETADVLKVSPETVMRDWKTAKAWLLRELSRTAFWELTGTMPGTLWGPPIQRLIAPPSSCDH